jgi:hypothetical protein
MQLREQCVAIRRFDDLADIHYRHAVCQMFNDRDGHSTHTDADNILDRKEW